MKSIEERAARYEHWADQIANRWDKPEEHIPFKEQIKRAFIAGAKSQHAELTRWHDPKQELPSPGQPVIICTSPKIYFLASYDAEFGDWFTGDSAFGRCEIIGWREIHE